MLKIELKVSLIHSIAVPFPGHKTYIAFLYLEHTQNNSVLHVFVELLMNMVRRKRLETSLAELDTEKGSIGQLLLCMGRDYVYKSQCYDVIVVLYCRQISVFQAPAGSVTVLTSFLPHNLCYRSQLPAHCLSPTHKASHIII